MAKYEQQADFDRASGADEQEREKMTLEMLPEWPDETGRCDWGYYQEWKHAEARYLAAMARLRVAVEALQTIKAHGFHGSSSTASQALSAIGDLPQAELSAASSAEQQPGRGGT